MGDVEINPSPFERLDIDPHLSMGGDRERNQPVRMREIEMQSVAILLVRDLRSGVLVEDKLPVGGVYRCVKR